MSLETNLQARDADAELGRLVRQMPEGTTLRRDDDTSGQSRRAWIVRKRGAPGRAYRGRTPGDALRAELGRAPMTVSEGSS